MKQSKKQDIHGVVLLNKPQGISSNRALQRVKAKLNAKKAGHTGSLDPLATGLLPICLGQATKVSEYLLGSDKRYQATIRLGQITDTYDSQGEIIEERAVSVNEAQLANVIAQFNGEIQQVPPMYSALKRSGQPLYKLARAGKKVELEPREVQIYALEYERIDECHVSIDTTVSSGFYIRSLAYDIGQALGCGAHITQLKRVSIREIKLSQAIDLSILEDMASPLDILRPIDELITFMPKIVISQAQHTDLSQGRKTISDAFKASEEMHRIYKETGELVAVGWLNEQHEIKTKKQFIFCKN